MSERLKTRWQTFAIYCGMVGCGRLRSVSVVSHGGGHRIYRWCEVCDRG